MDNYLKKARQFRDQGQLEEAIACYQKAIEDQPDYPWSHFRLGQVYQQAGFADQALTAFRRAVELDPEFAQAHQALAEMLLAQGEGQSALEAYEVAAALDPSNYQVQFLLGRNQLLKGQALKAVKSLQQALLVKPDSTEALFFAASAFSAAGALAMAEKCFQKARSLKAELAGSEPDKCKSGESLFSAVAADAPARLKIGFAVSSDQLSSGRGDYFIALELAAELIKQFAWEVYFITNSENRAAVTVDALIVMDHDFDLSSLPVRSGDLLKIAWMRNWFDVWVEAASFDMYDSYWVSSALALEYVVEKRGVTPELLPLAGNPWRFSRGRFRSGYASDYCFTGSNWNGTRKIVEQLDPDRLPYKFAVFGANWEAVEKFSKYCRGLVPYQELPDVYASTKIVIDDAGVSANKWGSVNSRVFEALLAGALVITNDKAGAAQLFGGMLPVYESKQELEDLLDQYLFDDLRRQQKVAELAKIVAAGHRYDHRARAVKRLLIDAARVKFKISPN